MKRLLWLLLLCALPSYAFTSVKSGAYITANNVAKAADIQCAGISMVDTNNNPQAVVTDCVVRIAVIENDNVMNFCYRFASYDLFSAVLNKSLSLYDLAKTTKSANWSWAPALQQVPQGIDPRCVQ